MISPARTDTRRTAQIVLSALIVLALLGAVAIAATGSTPGASAAERSPSHVFVDTFFTFSLVLLLIAAVLMVYGLSQRRAIAEHMALHGFRRFGLLPFLIFVALFTTAAYFRLRAQGFAFNRGGQDGAPQPGDHGPSAGDNLRDYHANFAWLPLLVVIALAAGSYLAWRLSAGRRATEADDPETVAESLAVAIEDTLEDLRAEQDPRRAIIAAYARMERALAAFGFPRSRSETQQEYLARILGDLDVETAAIRRLTVLFTQAKFSHHEVGSGMKEEAIAALEQVRDELLAAEGRRAAELEESLEMARA